MADVHGSPADAPQNPQATSAGSAPVPYQGTRPGEPPVYGVDLGPMSDAAAEVMNGIPAMPTVHESAVAHDIAAGLADAPYAPGSTSPIYVGGDDDAGGTDNVRGSVDAAVSAATARWQEYEGYTHQQGSMSGDLMDLPPVPPQALPPLMDPYPKPGDEPFPGA